MNIDDHNDPDLDLLTDEERAGLDESDTVDDADEGGEGNDAGDNDDDNGDDGAADGGKGNEGDDAGAKPNAKDGQEGRDNGDVAGADDDDDDDAPAASTAERVDAAATQTRLDAITSEKKALEDKLDEGEITTKEFTASVDRLNDEKNTLSNALAQQQAAEKAVTEKWYGDVTRFLDKNPELKANDTRLQSFDAVVRRVTGDPANATLSNRKQLELARATWRQEMGFSEEATPKPKEGEGKPTKKAPVPKPELPPTLHNVPAADIEVGDDGKFSHLEALLNAGKSIEFENALSKLSEADQQDYLSRN